MFLEMSIDDLGNSWVSILGVGMCEQVNKKIQPEAEFSQFLVGPNLK